MLLLRYGKMNYVSRCGLQLCSYFGAQVKFIILCVVSAHAAMLLLVVIHGPSHMG